MILFDASKIISFNDFDRFLCCKKREFETKKQYLFEQYGILKPIVWNDEIEHYQKFRDKYRNLVKTIILDVLKFYRSFLPHKCLIAQFGSFVKHTERIASDIDFTVCYDEPKTEKYECAEELIDYSIASIFGYSIDHVHGKFQHYPQMHDFDLYTERDNLYRLYFGGQFVDYKCGPETLKENLMNIKNVRDYKSMIAGYEEKYIKKCNIDCLYSVEILENNTKHDFIGDLSKLEHKYDICDGYKFRLEDFVLNNSFSVSEIKHALKNAIVEFYIFIAKLRKTLKFCDEYSMNIDMLWNNKILINFFGKSYISRMKSAFIKFFISWNRIELSLNMRGIALSTRCYKKISVCELNNLLRQDWGASETIENIIFSRNNLIHIVREGLKETTNV